VTEENGALTLRSLAGGVFFPMRFHSLSGRRLQVELPPDSLADQLQPGTLVEMQHGREIYLGEVYGRQGEFLIIGVEHIVDIDSLAIIRRVWQDHPAVTSPASESIFKR
jgi:hypothetical protein